MNTLNDLQNLMAGKNYNIMITIPNKVIRKYPAEVMMIQKFIFSQLEEFNKRIKGLEEKAKIEIGEKEGGRYGR